MKIIGGTVLNLVINGIPSIQRAEERNLIRFVVLNLVINGIPSIQCCKMYEPAGS